MPDFNLSYPGFGGYSLEEDEEDRRRREMAAAQSRSIPMPQRPTMAALLPQADPEMDARWRQAEQQALSRGGYGEEQSYGIGEGIRDFAPMAIGGVLDVLLNKGRGLGTLAAGGTQALSMERSRRDKAQGQQADYALRVRKEREGNAGMGIGAYHAALRGEELDLARSREQRMLQQQDPKVDGEMRAAELRRMNAMASESEARAARDPNATDPLDAEYKRAQIAKLRSETGAPGQAKQDSPDLAYRKQRDAEKDASDAAEADALVQQIPGTRITNPEAFKRAMSDKVTRRQIEQAVAGYRGSLTALDNMEGLREREGVMMLDADKAGEYGIQKRAALGGLSPLAQLGTLQKSDIELLEPILPDPGLGMQDVSRLVGKDIKLDALRGAKKGFRDLVDPRLAQWGIAYDYDFDPNAPPPEAAAPPPGAPTFRAGSGRAQAAGAQPMPGGRTDQLPVTDQKRGDVIRVDEYLQKLRDEDDDLGVRYR